MPCNSNQGPHSDPKNCRVCHGAFEWKWSSALSKSTSQKICSLAKLRTAHVPAGNTHHDMRHDRSIVPMPSLLCHRACRIAPVPLCPEMCCHALAVPPCLCQCACARAIAPVPSCPLHCTHAIVPPSHRVSACAIASCSITSNTQAANIASVTYTLMVQLYCCCYRLY